MPRNAIEVATLKHKQAKRRNIPTAELEPEMREEDKAPIRLTYARRNRDLDPQLVWHDKNEQDWSDLIRQSKVRAAENAPQGPDFFADFNDLPDKEAVTEL